MSRKHSTMFGTMDSGIKFISLICPPRNFGIESHLFSKSQFDRINKFVEAHSYHFTPLDSLHDNITDTDDDSDLVADVDPDTLIRIVELN